MVENDLLVNDEGALLTLTVNRAGKCNPLSRSVLAKIAGALRAASGRAGLKCAVIRGAGDRWFAAGGDLRDLDDVRTEQQANAMVEQCRGVLDSVREFPLPVVALLNGDAIGGGAELAVACDFRLMSAHARIGFVHARLHITPAWGGGTDLMSLVGRARALRMMTRAELVEAATAREWGLADAILPAGDPAVGAREFLAPLLECSASVLREFKAQAIAARRGLSFDERRRVEREGFVRSWVADAHWQAVERILGGR